MPKNNETNLTKKQKEKITEEILSEINETVKADLVKEVANEVRNEFNSEEKNKIKDEVTEEIIGDIKTSIKKDQNKILRKRKFKLFRFTIYTLVLLVACIYIIIRLYQTSNLDVLHKGLDKKVSNAISVETKEVVTTTEIVKDLNYYKTNYNYLVENLKVSDTSILKGKYDVSDIDLSDKLAMAYNALSSEEILVDGSIYTVDEDKIKSSYDNIFGSDDNGYDTVEFTTNGINFVYSQTNDDYIAISSSTNEEEVFNNMIYVEEDNTLLKITCNVAIVKSGYVYNINNRYYKLAEATDGNVDFDSISSNKLSSVEYTFENVNGSYVLKSIEKK